MATTVAAAVTAFQVEGGSENGTAIEIAVRIRGTVNRYLLPGMADFLRWIQLLRRGGILELVAGRGHW